MSKDNSARRAFIKDFVKGVRRQITEVEQLQYPNWAQRQAYKLRPKTYVGYTHSAEERWTKDDEEPHNVLFALVVEICEVRHSIYKLKKFIVALIGEEVEAAYAKLIVAAIADCYYATGKGFNIANDILDLQEKKAMGKEHMAAVTEIREIVTRMQAYLDITATTSPDLGRIAQSAAESQSLDALPATALGSRSVSANCDCSQAIRDREGGQGHRRRK